MFQAPVLILDLIVVQKYYMLIDNIHCVEI